MLYETVMKNAPNINFFSWDMLTNEYFMPSVILIILFIFLFWFIFNIGNKNADLEKDFLNLAKIIKKHKKKASIILFLGAFILLVTTRFLVLSANVGKWQQDYVVPYIKNLKESKQDNIIDIELFEGEEGVDMAKVKWFENGNIESEIFHDVFFDEKIKKPYITYKINDKDFTLNKLGDYKKGEAYFHKLYLPIEMGI